jgi:iodotyrosine deiodinase
MAMDAPQIPLNFAEKPPQEMRQSARQFRQAMQQRRTTRDFSDRPVPRELIEEALAAAGSAPSGANLQPWHFVVVSAAKTKREIRAAAEKEERQFYEQRAPEEWLDALRPLGLDAVKPFLETAPYTIAIFLQKYAVGADKNRKNYYTSESVGIATGLLITALHLSGLCSLVHTPSPRKFLNKILKRPDNERPYLLLVVGYPAADATVPDIARLPLDEIATFIE